MPLTVTDLRKDYPTRSGPLAVLAGVSLTLADGDAVAIMGPSGSGKSTLLHILGTLDRPTAGTVTLDGQDPFAFDDAGLAKFRNERIGFVFQDHHLLPQFNVLENVLIPTLVNPHRDAVALEAAARQLLDRVGLGSRLDHRPAELSGGERQRVALARALVQKPKLVLADEPTGNLDRKNAHAVGELLLDLHRQQGTILIAVTHSAELAGVFPRRLEMNDGRLEGGA
ncbi:ABC transporter ATP-binding protein [Limnoglobus roseus]|uniref:ABC transporter ATP-binding protein n=1 Tax=Limnoglobus roseus TaxID=2598579 RepID=A0A5C1AGU1_9BACT|nr:ABC transporter ATP-binding protein [Limnoglobus roseus]QEL16962.1 ABC transporter ATP-binding protein [Limnoglobus roseus]